jgi:hypothetical protein
MSSMAIDGQEYEFEDANQSWIASWYPPSESTIEGKRHGSGAVCRTVDEQIVFISQHGVKWEHPAGRPEGDETWRQTLDSEVMLQSWEPEYEVQYRKLVSGNEADDAIDYPRGMVPIYYRWLVESHLN